MSTSPQESGSGKENRLSPLAHSTLALAEEVARGLNHDSIDSAHILLALAHQEEGLPAQVFKSLGKTPAQLHYAVETVLPRGNKYLADKLELNLDAKKTISLAYDQIIIINSDQVEPEHLLIAITLLSPNAKAAQALKELGIDPNKIRQEVGRLKAERQEREQQKA